ncbi:MAG: hypothetical protein NTV30_02440 [Chloroflexi bacterium]|nr:hypothetical protein [Chloroflexota bacterium]
MPGVGISYIDMMGQIKDEAIIRKVPECRVISVPRPSPTLTAQQIAKNMVPALITGLTKPLTEKEMYKGNVVPPRPARIAFEGTYDEIQNFFIGDLTAFEDVEPHTKWTDGLPIIPPTTEKVAEMLSGTSHSPEEEFDVINFEADVGYKPTTLGLVYNVEKVAINAVMAGCRPEYMPICLAIAETHPGRYITTTASADFGVVTGPIAKELGMASKRNAMMTGNLANASLGRFMTLFRHNIAQFVPDVAMQHPQGNPVNKGLVFAENFEGSPWTNLSEEFGFKRDENTYTRFHSKGMWDYGVTMYGGHWDSAYSHAATHGYEPGDVLVPAMNLMKASGMPKYFIILINPEDVARIADKSGLKTKEDARKWVYENCTLTYNEFKHRFAWPPSGWEHYPDGSNAGHPGHDAVNQCAEQGITVDKVTDDTIVHLPSWGPSWLYFVHLGSGTPIPTFIRGNHCVTVSIDKWR